MISRPPAWPRRARLRWRRAGRPLFCLLHAAVSIDRSVVAADGDAIFTGLVGAPILTVRLAAGLGN